MRKFVACVFIICVYAIAAAGAAWGAETATPAKPVASLPMLAGTVVPDGNLNEPMWAKAFTVQIPRRYGEATLSAANDATGQAKLFWNNEGLHVSVNVNDRKMSFAKANEDIESNDSVEICLDLLWVRVGLTADNKVQTKVTHLGNWLPLPDSDVKAGVRKTSSGYTVEVVITNSAVKAVLGKELAQGQQIRIAAGINNRYSAKDVANNGRYYPSMYSWNNVESFALVELK